MLELFRKAGLNFRSRRAGVPIATGLGYDPMRDIMSNGPIVTLWTRSNVPTRAETIMLREFMKGHPYPVALNRTAVLDKTGEGWRMRRASYQTGWDSSNTLPEILHGLE